MKFDFNHIDPRTGMPRIKNRPEDEINLMSRKPGRSCWIKLLQNRVNLNSVGNLHDAQVMWYDRLTDSLYEDSSMESEGILFRLFRLRGHQYPQGWIYYNGR